MSIATRGSSSTIPTYVSHRTVAREPLARASCWHGSGSVMTAREKPARARDTGRFGTSPLLERIIAMPVAGIPGIGLAFAPNPCLSPGQDRRAGSACAIDHDFDQRAVVHHGFDVGALPDPSDLLEDLTALRRVGDLAGDGRDIGAQASLEMDRDLRVRLDVGQPAAPLPERHSTDVQA